MSTMSAPSLIRVTNRLCKQAANIQSYTRQYQNGSGVSTGYDVIDLRSDVLSVPTEEMLSSMPTATLGDDVFGEDETTNNLQKKIAQDFGMESALFMPSGTMGNLISVLAHCPERGGEVLLGDMSHIYLYEQGGIAQLGGLHPRSLKTNKDGTLDLSKITNYIRPTADPHQPLTRLLCVENTHNFCGGTILPDSFLKEMRGIADDIGVPLHMDGARVMNAVVALKSTPAEVLKYVDSVNLCFSKGLGAPIGSIIAGSKTFIDRAERLRKVLGGGMRQTGVLTAAAAIAYRDAYQTLAKDHKHTNIIAKTIDDHPNTKVKVDMNLVHTNLIMVDTTDGLDAKTLCDRLAKVTSEEKNELKEGISIIIRALVFSSHRARIVLHNGITEEDTYRAVKKINYVLNEML